MNPTRVGPAPADRLSLILIISVATLLYLNALGAPFQYDDEPGIVRNNMIKNLDHIEEIVRYGGPARPLLTLSYALNYHWGGLDPFGYHLVNLLLHILNGVLVYFILKSLFEFPVPGDSQSPDRARRVALFAALLFVSHPAQTEAVTYVWGRSDVLCTLFTLATLWLFLKSSRFHQLSNQSSNVRRTGLWLYSGSLLCFLFALASKEIAVSLPLILLLFDFCYISGGHFQKVFRRALPRHFPFLLIALARVGFHYSSLAFSRLPDQDSLFLFDRGWPEGLNVYTNVLTQIHAVAAYAKILYYPFNLNVDHDFPVARSVFDPAVLASLGLISVFVAAAIALYTRSRFISFGIFWFLITLSFYFFIPLPELLVERRLYLPSVGFCVIVAVLLNDLTQQILAAHSAKRARTASAILLLIIVISYSTATINRNAVWGDPYLLWSDAVKKSPQKLRPRINRATASLRQGKVDEALGESKKALELFPGAGQAHHNLLTIYTTLGRRQEAIDHFKEMLRTSPAYAAKWYMDNHKTLKASEKKLFHDAVSAIEQEASSVPGNADTHLAMGLLYLEMGRDRTLALHHLEAGLRQPPSQSGFKLRVVQRIAQRLKTSPQFMKQSHGTGQRE